MCIRDSYKGVASEKTVTTVTEEKTNTGEEEVMVVNQHRQVGIL